MLDVVALVVVVAPFRLVAASSCDSSSQSLRTKTVSIPRQIPCHVHLIVLFVLVFEVNRLQSCLSVEVVRQNRVVQRSLVLRVGAFLLWSRLRSVHPLGQRLS